MNQASDICNRLYALARECNGQNVELTLNDVSILLVQDLDDADRILRADAGHYAKNLSWLRQTLGPSRFSENGERWRVRRDLTQPHFNHFDRVQVTQTSRRCANRTLAALAADSAAGRRALDDDKLRRLTLSVLLESFFGISLEASGIDPAILAELMELGAEYSFVPPGKTIELYHERLQRLPALRRRLLEDFRVFRDGTVPDTPLLRSLLAADRDPGNDIVLEQELVTFFAAGAEATAAALGWACQLLAAHPSAQQRLRTAVASDGDSDEHRGCEEALERFISETLRLYPTSPISSRVALTDTRLGQRAIAAGQNVMISWIGVQHDARRVPDPWRMRLDRSGDDRRLGSRTAFSLGPRMCGGKQFALVEMAAILREFLRSARFTLLDDAPPRFHWRSQLLREGGQPVLVELMA
jgi:cytochrome P450